MVLSHLLFLYDRVYIVQWEIWKQKAQRGQRKQT